MRLAPSIGHTGRTGFGQHNPPSAEPVKSIRFATYKSYTFLEAPELAKILRSGDE